MDSKDDKDHEIPFFQAVPTAARPLAGLTVLVVEDSRFASEAMRLLCLRSGARIRRADCLASAHRHLSIYRPSVAIIDIGLPDGSGLELLGELSRANPRVPVLLGTSGAEREAASKSAIAAGADGFLPKPIESLTAFQTAILEHLPKEQQPRGPRRANLSVVEPDELALKEDLSHAIDLLEQDMPPVSYLKPFLLGLARTARDTSLMETARDLPGQLAQSDRARLRDLLRGRVEQLKAV